MQVAIVAVGRVRDAALRDVCGSYARRIGRYLRLDLREVREAGRSERDAALARRQEHDAIQHALPRGARVFALTRRGQALTSAALADRLAQWQQDARDVALVIGGAHGLDARTLAGAEDRLSLSPLTLPHHLARLVLLEQLYRACTILRGEPYHKGRD